MTVDRGAPHSFDPSAPRITGKLRTAPDPLPAGEGAQGGVPAFAGKALLFTVSAESEDRAGDVIVASGWDLSAYERNSVVLWAHQHSAPPIGRSLRTWVEGRSLMAQVEFAPTPFAQEVRRLYEEGFLRGVSVGFRAIETEPRRTGTGAGRGVLFKRQELLEISAAPVPMHPDALMSERGASGTALPAGEGMTTEAVVAYEQLRRLWEEIGALA